jgi:hypothetical protein
VQGPTGGTGSAPYVERVRRSEVPPNKEYLDSSVKP